MPSKTQRRQARLEKRITTLLQRKRRLDEQAKTIAIKRFDLLGLLAEAEAELSRLRLADEPPGLRPDGRYITGTGQVLVQLHAATEECRTHGCVIHHPTDPHQDWPTHWRDDRGLMERLCPHGVGHPDRDAINYIRRTRGEEAAKWEGVHGCDGCCAVP